MVPQYMIDMLKCDNTRQCIQNDLDVQSGKHKAIYFL